MVPRAVKPARPRVGVQANLGQDAGVNPIAGATPRGGLTMHIDLTGKVAIVTGAGRGIGREIAATLAGEGVTTAVTDVRQEYLDSVAEEFAGRGWVGRQYLCDVRDAERIGEVVSDVVRAFGRIDILVNNAGYRIRSPLEDLPRSEWDAMVATNLTGVFLFSQAVGRVMIRQRGGKIITVTSTAGRTGSRGMAAYAAAKAGAAVLTQSLGAEWAKYGILVNAVAPGPVETEGVLEVWKTPAMIAQAARDVPLQRLGRPEEIAWAVVFVASDQASFMTGETLYVSGGPRVANREDTK
jgi:NAD(P)-dependent dehydrogenase (short-subunit alcohol dehydrogenase family)